MHEEISEHKPHKNAFDLTLGHGRGKEPDENIDEDALDPTLGHGRGERPEEVEEALKSKKLSSGQFSPQKVKNDRRCMGELSYVSQTGRTTTRTQKHLSQFSSHKFEAV